MSLTTQTYRIHILNVPFVLESLLLWNKFCENDRTTKLDCDLMDDMLNFSLQFCQQTFAKIDCSLQMHQCGNEFKPWLPAWLSAECLHTSGPGFIGNTNDFLNSSAQNKNSGNDFGCMVFGRWGFFAFCATEKRKRRFVGDLFDQNTFSNCRNIQKHLRDQTHINTELLNAAQIWLLVHICPHLGLFSPREYTSVAKRCLVLSLFLYFSMHRWLPRYSHLTRVSIWYSVGIPQVLQGISKRSKFS